MAVLNHKPSTPPGLTLSKMGYDAELAHKISTPPHRAMIGAAPAGFRVPLSSEYGTYTTVQTRLWPRRSGNRS